MYQPTHIKRILGLALAAALFLFIAAACAPTGGEPAGQDSASTPTTQATPTIETTTPPAAAPLEGTRWQLVAFEKDGVAQSPVAGTEITAEFADGMVGGSAGCNHYGGTYEVDGQNLAISELFQTEMACMNDGVMEQETAFTAAMTRATSYTLEGNTLVITSKDGLLRFTAVEPPAGKPLEGTRWLLTAFTSGEVTHSLLSGTEITAGFTDGKVAGSAGCNNYFADYTLAGDQITLGPVGATRMACAGDIMAQESEFLAALGAAGTLTINGNQLTLTHPNGTLLFTAAQEAGN